MSLPGIVAQERFKVQGDAEPKFPDPDPIIPKQPESARDYFYGFDAKPSGISI
ncbi:hypothetical protein JCM31598_16650 [Desulfonatronum parangueonense]